MKTLFSLLILHLSLPPNVLSTSVYAACRRLIISFCSRSKRVFNKFHSSLVHSLRCLFTENKKNYVHKKNDNKKPTTWNTHKTRENGEREWEKNEWANERRWRKCEMLNEIISCIINISENNYNLSLTLSSPFVSLLSMYVYINRRGNSSTCN